MRYFVSFAILIVLVGFSLSFAQQDKKDRIEALKIAFITNKLELTSKEAQVFWPVYNEYADKHEKLRKDRRQQFMNVKDNLDAMSDKDIEALVDGEMTFRQKELDLQKEYHAQFKQVLPVRKVAKLYIAEETFKRELLRKLQEQKK
ncbi:MAG: hypothetical protein K2X86_06495 [Cytophagaceae bacterium]|nr:hypothetical protein [Cytophagaceae bacterium]